MQESAFDPSRHIADELKLPLERVRAVIGQLAEGASVPFIARYRKERTGGLDEVQIRAIDEQNAYCLELDERRRAVRAEIESQGKLTPELAAKIDSCWIKAALEDIYLPFKPKRRTRAAIARERGLEPLADRILAQPAADSVAATAARFVDAAKGVPDVKAALAGARDIVAETLAERGDVRAALRHLFRSDGVVVCEAVKSKTKEPTKFETYYDFQEKVRSMASHRFLAVRRGESEGVLRVAIRIDKDAAAARVATLAPPKPRSPFAGELSAAIEDAVSRLLCPSLETELRAELKLAADREAVAVFAANLRGLLLAPALGRQRVLGIDPGQRTGCKCVAVDDTGKLLHHTVIHLVSGDQMLARAKETLIALLARYAPFAIAVGNGTHGRETADFCREVVSGARATALVVLVSESGASVYSASDVARQEYPDLDLTVRGAISIAHRLQDPLAELVKIDPKAIGVGQYQHDVHQPLLKQKLEDVVESCVNAVGVELNTASAPLLSHVAGIGESLATRIVEHRNAQSAFRTRKQLLDVPGLGPKAFEQCAGFVRIRGGGHPLDASAVHPERYSLLARIAADARVKVEDLVGNPDAVAKIPWSNYVSDDVGLPTLQDIRAELVKPGRDPRDAFEAPAFRDDVRTLADLAPGMELEGVVTNVTAFGAFVDVGVHQDGLVHVSQLADRFVRDPHEVAKVGDKIKVRVLEIDPVRKRIALSARSKGRGEPPAGAAATGKR
jgi:protein Tex